MDKETAKREVKARLEEYIQREHGIKNTKHNFKIFTVGSIFWLAFTDKEHIKCAEDIDADSMKHFKILYHALLENGVYSGPSGYEVGFMSEAHTIEDIEKTIVAFEKAFAKL